MTITLMLAIEMGMPWLLVRCWCRPPAVRLTGKWAETMTLLSSKNLGFEVEFRDDVQKSIPSSDAGSWFGLGRNPSGGFDVDRMFCLAGTAFAGDATSSGIWRRSKLQGLFLTSACMTYSKRLESNTKYIEAFTFHTTVWLARQLHLLIVVVLWWS